MSSVSTEGPSGLGSPLQSQFIKPSHNPIQLAAISNYKLAQLTFAPPDLNSLRKTAIIKNVLEDVYTNTPEEWLQQMTRWQFFTAESLEEMTQEGLEEIFQQYSQTIEAFRPIKSFPPPFDDIEDELDDDEEGGDDLWVAEDDAATPVPKTNSLDSSSSLFSQPNTNLSNESVEIRPPSLFSDKPLPASPMNEITAATTASRQPQQGGGVRRNSGFNGNMNRLSWTSDTGITSNVVSQNLANEIMNLFDMDFSVDIKLNTAPKLPELPFRPRRKSQQQQRQSQDMLSTLIPAFDKIALENSQLHKRSTPVVIRSVPQRSSSLKHREQMMEEDLKSRVAAYKSPIQESLDKVKPKKKSRLRLSSLMIKKHKEPKEKDHHPSPESSPKKNSINNHTAASNQQQKTRKTSTSTIESTSSSSWSYVSDVESAKTPTRSHKPLPEAPLADGNTESKSSLKNKKKKKKGNKIHKQVSSKSINHSDNTLETEDNMNPSSDMSTTEYSHTSDESIESLGIATNNLMKRMASFNWRIKSRGKVVEV
ncbi:hypothetical protein K501DRAFT_322889 [Backusella circina FSU 941]|nr:hypothetical protein K501DRAFT_322889 [Backusella circina FSU 941]